MIWTQYFLIFLVYCVAAASRPQGPTSGVGGMVMFPEPLLVTAEEAAAILARHQATSQSDVSDLTNTYNHPNGLSDPGNQAPEEQQNPEDLAAAAPAMEPKFAQMFEQHNSLRAYHGAAPLAWDDGLARDAGTYAQTCIWGHDKEAKKMYQGENLATAAGYTEADAMKFAVQGWYSEIENYDFDNPGTAKPNATGAPFQHFTQLVWRGTTTVGCAIQYCSQVQGSFPNALYTICRYSPMGNIQYFADDPGKLYRENVLRPGSVLEIQPSPAPESTPAPSPSNPPSPAPCTPSFPNNLSSPNPDCGTGIDNPPKQPPATGPNKDTLLSGDFIVAPGCLVSASQRYKLCLSASPAQLQLLDGDKVTWKVNMPRRSRAPYILHLNPYATLIVLDAGFSSPVWKAPVKQGQEPYVLKITDAGRLILTGNDKILWSKKA